MPSLTFIVNKSIFFSGVIPITWKETKVNPLFKPGPRDDINNYRITVSKVIEKWVDRQLNCGMQYVGQTNRMLKPALISTIISKSRMDKPKKMIISFIVTLNGQVIH